MSVLVAASVLHTCLGDGAATFAALLDGRDGRQPLRHLDPERLRVAHGYHVAEPPGAFGPSRWLADCVRAALADAGVDPARQRVSCLVGTGLRELGTLEDVGPAAVAAERMHFGDAVRAAAPGLDDVLTVSNACAAGSHALAIAQDMLELGDADVVVVGATDAMTVSMLAMIGRVVDEPTDRVRPFDADRRGVLLGEGAAAVVLVPDDDRTPALGRILATGLSCDAEHETAPSAQGIERAIRDGLDRAGLGPADVGVVIAHGTGTALNDPAECLALRRVLLEGGGNPLVTGIKGAVGHMSGTAALANLDVALRCLRTRRVPATIGLRHPLPQAEGLRIVAGQPLPLPPGAIQVDAFGFGGVNAVTLVAA